MPQNQTFELGEANFYAWVFGNNGGMIDSSGLDVWRQRLDTLMQLRIEEVDRVCRLSPAQRQKLKLAGAGDVKRFMDQVDDKKRFFDRLKHDQNNINEIFQEIQPLQQRYNSGLFGDDSILAKSVRRSLDPAQVALYDRMTADRARYRYRAKVETNVLNLSNSIGLTSRQRRQFVDLLVAETRPPRRFDNMDYYIIFYQAAHLPESKLRPIFDAGQWKLVVDRLDQARAMRPSLIQGNYLAEGSPGFDRSPPEKLPDIQHIFAPAGAEAKEKKK